MQEDFQQYLLQATQAEQQKQWPQAVELYRNVLNISPNHQIAMEKLAWCLSLDKEYDQALVVLQDLMKSQPERAKWPYMIGYQYHEMEKWSKALEWYEQALALNPDYIVVLYRKGYAHTKLIKTNNARQMIKAIQAFEKCRKLWHALPDSQQKQQDKSNCAKAAYHQAKVLLDHPALSHDATEAIIRLLKEAIQLDPNDHNKYYLLGKTYFENNQFDRYNPINW